MFAVGRARTGRTEEEDGWSRSGALIPLTSGCHFLSADSSPAGLICLRQMKDTFLIIRRQRFSLFFFGFK